MIKTIEGSVTNKGKNIAVVVSRFNDFITKHLLKGCLGELTRLGVKDRQITVVWVPGSYEIPIVALKMSRKKSIHAVICLGAVIRGETMHFELVAKSAAEGIAQVALTSGKPVIFGVLTTDTVEQAVKRSLEKGNNKGREAARNALEMINLLNNLK